MTETPNQSHLKPQVDLSLYDNSWYSPQRGFICRMLWHLVNVVVLQNPLNVSSRLKVWALRVFGARVGRAVVLKPGINVKYPWHLDIGDHVWIGEKVWLDSLVNIRIGSHVCISQGAYLCTGNHDWTDPGFGLLVRPIEIENGAWIGAGATVLPGVVVASHAVLASGGVLSQNAQAYMIYAGNPATAIKSRVIQSQINARFADPDECLNAATEILDLNGSSLEPLPLRVPAQR